MGVAEENSEGIKKEIAKKSGIYELYMREYEDM